MKHSVRFQISASAPSVLLVLAVLTMAAPAATVAATHDTENATAHDTKNATVVEQRLNASLNSMVTRVEDAETPEAKRAILDGYLDRAESAADKAEHLPLLGSETRGTLGALRASFRNLVDRLHGTGGVERVSDGGLNAFAGQVRGDVQQALSTNGGIYLSTGTIIIILLILLILL